MSQEAPFDRAAGVFLEYEDSVVGRLRYTLARETARPYLPRLDRRYASTMLDACGGSGPDTAWLADQGYAAYLVDPSGEQIDRAKERLRSLDDSALSHIMLVQGGVKDLRDYDGYFDGAFSHVVASYMEDPMHYWKSIVRRIKRGGMLSVLENGHEGAIKMLCERGDENELEKYYATGWYTNNIGIEVRTFTFEDIERSLKKLGMSVVSKAGIRIEVGHINEPVDLYGQKRFRQLLSSERRLSKDPSRMHEASLLQIIARKN